MFTFFPMNIWDRSFRKGEPGWAFSISYDQEVG